MAAHMLRSFGGMHSPLPTRKKSKKIRNLVCLGVRFDQILPISYILLHVLEHVLYE